MVINDDVWAPDKFPMTLSNSAAASYPQSPTEKGGNLTCFSASFKHLISSPMFQNSPFECTPSERLSRSHGASGRDVFQAQKTVSILLTAVCWAVWPLAQVDRAHTQSSTLLTLTQELHTRALSAHTCSGVFKTALEHTPHGVWRY